MSCAPSSDPNVDCRLAIPTSNVTVLVPSAPRRPFPRPGSAAALSTTVPGTDTTLKMASFVAPRAVAATSMESVPGCRLTGTENAPDDPAVAVVIVVAGAAAPAAVPLTATSPLPPGGGV